MFRVGDSVIYKHKCMWVIGWARINGNTKTTYQLRDILTGDAVMAEEDEIKLDDKCLDKFYDYGEIE